MRRFIKSVVLLSVLFAYAGCAGLTSGTTTLTYPVTTKGTQVDDYHGVQVADPYRWLEDDNSKETAAWVKAQNKVTKGYLKHIPARKKISKRLTKLWDYEKYRQPFKKGERYFYEKNNGLQNHYVLYTMKSLDDKPRVLLDPNKLSSDGTVSVSGQSLSEDGSLLAYAISESGSDWKTWHVRNVETGKDLDDEVEWSKFSGASWTHDNSGFFYSRYDAPEEGAELKSQNHFHKLYFHKLNTKQSEDVLVYDRPDQKEWGFGGYVTEDGQYLIISVSKGTERKNLVFFKNLASPDSPFVELISEFENQYVFVGNDGPVFFFRSDNEAPLSRLIAIDIRNPSKYNWKEIVPQSQDTLRSVSLVNNMFVASYLHDAQTNVRIFGMDGSHVRDVKLPGIGSAWGFGGKKTDTETFYSFTGFTTPGAVYRYDLATGTSTLFRKPQVDFDADEYETQQVFYYSKDGKRIPMFITHKKGLVLDGNNPTLLYGYGGFNIPLTPSFSVGNLVWMEMGGVYAMPNLRGGGEYGKPWHEGGMKLTKQNTFNDFIAAAEWLIENKYTNSSKLAIRGRSNGGLLVGACMTQRPDLFAVALPGVGVLDMLRFNKFTIGWAWESDYGSPQNAEEFKALYSYSPLHNLKQGTAYPATLINTADHDDRVFPAHSFKFAAALQAAHTGDNPVLIRIETKAGHGAGKPTTKRIAEIADEWAFVVQNLGMTAD